MAIIPSPIFQNTGSPDLFYKAQGSDSYTKIGGPSELQNLAKQGLIEVGKQYQQLPQQSTQPTPPVAPSANSSPAGTIQNPNIPAPGTMETTPGVFKASSLKSYYDNRAEILKSQYEAANKDIQDIYGQVQSLKAPDYQSLYQQGYQQNVASIDENLNKTTQTLTSLDDNIRKLEDDVRGEVGGRAPESVIQAEVARRAKPLLLQRQTYVDQIQNLQGMRQNALQSVQQGLDFQRQSYEDQRGLLGTRLELAQKSVDDFNVLLEKGAAASDKDIDNFRQNFSLLLEQAPDVLQNLSQDEYQQLQSGFVPQSVMTRIANTISEQKLASKSGSSKDNLKYIPATKYQSAGYFNEATGEFTPIGKAINQSSGSGGSGSSSGSGGYVAPIVLSRNTPTPHQKTFEEFLAEEEDKAGMTFGPAKRALLKKKFDEQQIAQKSNTVSAASPSNVDISKFDPTVQLIILGKQKVPEPSSKEYSRIKNQLLQATRMGLLDEKGKQTDTSKITADQYNSATFVDRMLQAENVFTQTAPIVSKAPLSKQFFQSNRLTPNVAKDPVFQQQQQAERNFITAVLRKESGAAISDSEFENARKQYFPQPGDSSAVLAQKAANRQIVINGMKRAAGSALQSGSSQSSQGSNLRQKYNY